MSDDQKILMALVAAGLALLGTIFTAIMNYRSQREQARSKATTDMAIPRLNATLQDERDKRLAQLEAEKIISKFRDPLMHAAYDLQSRIYNILKQRFLPTYYTGGSKREQEYAVENTVFLLAQFLGWTELIRQEVQFLDLSSDDQTRTLRELQDSFSTQLRSDRSEFGTGFRLFAGEQRAVGELMIDRATGVPRCIGFATLHREERSQFGARSSRTNGANEVRAR